MKNVLLLLMLALSLSGCLRDYTQATHDKLLDQRVDLGAVQFYNSRRIVLERQITEEETRTMKGVIEKFEGKYYQQIVVPKNTYGKCVAHTDSTVSISFDPDEAGTFTFHTPDFVYVTGATYPYTLKTDEQKKSYFDIGKGWYTHYNGEEYLLIHPQQPMPTHEPLDEQALVAQLKYALKKKEEEKTNKRRLKGYEVK